MTPNDVQRFWLFVDKSTGGDSCWSWTGFCDRYGYGRFSVKSRMLSAHRASWEIANNKSPGQLHILHSCDNPQCVNPKYLFAGTHLDNMKDKSLKNRVARVTGKQNGHFTKPENTPRGEQNGRAKLTADQVQAIRERFAQGGITKAELAHRSSVGVSTIKRILANKSWRHLP